MSPAVFWYFMFNLEQLNSEWLVLVGIASAVMFVLSLLIVPIVVVRIPDNYFSTTHRNIRPWAQQHPIVRSLLIAGKNLLGVVLLLMGVLMLVFPGQGLLTILLGICLIDFSGKHVLIGRIVKMPKVLKSINWIRRKAKKNPLVFHEKQL